VDLFSPGCSTRDDGVGVATAGYMLEMAALEIENAMRFKRGTRGTQQP
jgi:hypothetical protein